MMNASAAQTQTDSYSAIMAPNIRVAAAANSEADQADIPLLVYLFTAQHGFKNLGARHGQHGSVYQLQRSTRVGRQEIQLGFDHDGRAKIARLIAPLDDNATINILSVQKAMALLAKSIRSNWSNAQDLFQSTLSHAFKDFSTTSKDSAYSIKTNIENDQSVLRVYPSKKIISYDLRPRVPNYQRLSREDVMEILYDATLTMVPKNKGIPYHVYHSPDHLLSGQRDDRETVDTGSWGVTPDGRYCVETAPEAGWRCALFVKGDENQLALMEITDDQPTGKVRATIQTTSGNNRDLFIARVPDTLSAHMVAVVSAGHEEEWREPGSNQTRRTQFYKDGTVRQPPEEGRWSILQDGRRCWRITAPDPGAWQCAFLRETDGGTFVHLNEGGTIIAESLFTPIRE